MTQRGRGRAPGPTGQQQLGPSFVGDDEELRPFGLA
jgi:hypothetical protein